MPGGLESFQVSSRQLLKNLKPERPTMDEDSIEDSFESINHLLLCEIDRLKGYYCKGELLEGLRELLKDLERERTKLENTAD